MTGKGINAQVLLAWPSSDQCGGICLRESTGYVGTKLHSGTNSRVAHGFQHLAIGKKHRTHSKYKSKSRKPHASSSRPKLAQHVSPSCHSCTSRLIGGKACRIRTPLSSRETISWRSDWHSDILVIGAASLSILDISDMASMLSAPGTGPMSWLRTSHELCRHVKASAPSKTCEILDHWKAGHHWSHSEALRHARKTCRCL